ncbi:MAG: ribose 5-phosphate isomerase B [bacterium]
MRIAIASDHAAFNLKEQIKEYLINKNIEVKDFGSFSDESSDYPIFAFNAAKSLANIEFDFGIMMCGSGQGMQMTANKIWDIRAALCHSVEMAKITRQHNNANVLTFGSRFIGYEMATEIVDAFINTPFEGGRHQRRIDLMNELTK